MRIPPLSTIVGLTVSASAFAVFPSAAFGFNFNFDALPNITTRPIASDNVLDFLGDYTPCLPGNCPPDTGLGYTAFFNGDTVFYNFGGTPPLDRGHTEISLNDPVGSFAPYYTTGRPTSIEDGVFNSTRSANLQTGTGFFNFLNILNSNSITPAQIGFSYGQKAGVDFKKTWNLGQDILGQDWFASPTSTIEERIYQANPNDVELYLTYQNGNGDEIKFINLGYTPLYSLFDYGATTASADTLEAVLSEPVKANITSGLSDPTALALANAFLQDVSLAGGNVQLVVDDSGVPDIEPAITTGNNFTYGVARLRLPISIRAGFATVPESSLVFGLFAFGALGLLSRPKLKS